MRRKRLARAFALVFASMGLAVVGGACAPDSDSSEVESGASALGDYDHCSKILEGDLFNKIVSRHATAESARAILERRLLSMNERDAYDMYRSYDDQAWRAGGGGFFRLFGVFALGGDGSRDRKVTREEFGQHFRRMKVSNASSDGYDWSDSSALTSAYASYIRDPNTIEAWRACVSAGLQPDLYAYGRRDDAGNAAVQIVWAPGYFGGFAPTIHVSFAHGRNCAVTPSSAEVAIGSGRTFRVECRPADRAIAIDVHVNGSSYDRRSGSLLGSFTRTAQIPPLTVKRVPDLPLPLALVGLGVIALAGLGTRVARRRGS